MIEGAAAVPEFHRRSARCHRLPQAGRLRRRGARFRQDYRSRRTLPVADRRPPLRAAQYPGDHFHGKGRGQYEGEAGGTVRARSAQAARTESAYVSTIHGFCARVLRENAIAAGIDPRFSVLDARESEELQYSCLNSALDELVELRRADALELIEALHNTRSRRRSEECVRRIRSAGKTIAEVRAMENPGAAVTPRETADASARTPCKLAGHLSDAQHSSALSCSNGPQSLANSRRPLLLKTSCDVVKRPCTCAKCPESEKQALSDFRERLPRSYRGGSRPPHRTLSRNHLRRSHALRRTLQRTQTSRAAASISTTSNAAQSIFCAAMTKSAIASATQFRQVMLDEFQDINEQQAELIELVRGEDVFFAVGRRQSIDLWISPCAA